MTGGPEFADLERPFQLHGHDCPLGEYPSVVVPVGEVGGQLVVVYTGDGQTQFRRVASNARYRHHGGITASILRGFDPGKHGLFAIDETDILIYNLGREKAFYSRLLRSSAAFSIEPFYRLSLALEPTKLH